MESSRFDDITRALTTGTSRRHTILGLGSGLLAGLLAHLGLEEATAACVKPGKKGCKGPRNKKCCPGARCTGGSKRKAGRCVCKRGLTKCGSTCVNTQINAQHCGACNNPCGEGETCDQGGCVCSGGLTLCGTTCVDTQTDKQHCGACDEPCGGTSTCQQGTCVSPLGCPAGGNVCDDAAFAACPGTDNPFCQCITDVEGTPRCSSTLGRVCSVCTTNAECGEGAACFDARGPHCQCSTGNACARATCEGVE